MKLRCQLLHFKHTLLFIHLYNSCIVFLCIVNKVVAYLSSTQRHFKVYLEWCTVYCAQYLYFLYENGYIVVCSTFWRSTNVCKSV